MLWVSHVCMIIGKSSIDNVSEDQNLIKNRLKWAYFLLLTGLLNTNFRGRNVFNDPSCIFFYPMVYDKGTFEKMFFATIYTHPHFCEIRITAKNPDYGEILLFGDVYLSLFTPLGSF